MADPTGQSTPSTQPTGETPWLGDAELEAWITTLAFVEAFPASIEAQLRRDGDINLFEYTVLAMLSEEPGRTMPMKDLAGVAFGSLSRLSHAVKRLEQRGWVERAAGSGGRRHNTVRLTNAGLAAIEAVAPRHVAHVHRSLVEPLTPAELSTFARLTRKLLRVVDPSLDEGLDDTIATVVARNRGTAGGEP